MPLDNYTKDFFKHVKTHLGIVGAKIDTLIAIVDRPAKNDRETANPKETANQEDYAAIGKAFLASNIAPTEVNANQTDKKWYKSFDNWKRGLEVVAVLIALFLAYVNYRQWSDTAKNFRLAQRPWVSSTPVADSPLSFNNQGAHLTLKFHLHNSGISPADDVFQGVGFQPLSKDANDARRQKQLACEGTVPRSPESEDIVFPNSDSIEKRTIFMSREDIDKNKKAGGYLFIHLVGCVAYRSTLNEGFVTSQIYTLDVIDPSYPPGVFKTVIDGVDVPAEKLSIIPENSDVLLGP